MLPTRWMCLLALFLPAYAHAEAPPAPVRGTLTLEAALNAARTSQPLMRQARASTELSRGKSDVSRSALLPQATATAQYQRTTSNFVFRPGNNSNSLAQTVPAASGATYNFFNFGLTGTQLIYDFGNSIDTYRAAKETVHAQSIAERTTLLSVEYNVRNAFFTARANKAAVAVAQGNLDNQNRHREQVEAFVAVGTRPEIDLAQTRTDVANARVQLIQANNNYDVARAALNQAMGVEGTLDFEVAEQTLPPLKEEDAAIDALLYSAVEGRPDLQVLAIQYRAQQLSLSAAKGQYGPALSATGAVTEAGTQIKNLGWNYNVGVLLSWTFLQGWITHGNVRQAKANMASLQAQADVLRQQVRYQLEQGRLAVGSARAALEASTEALASAQVQLQLAEGRYQAGVGNIIELGDAQLAFNNAESQRVQSEYNLAIARAQLLNALGRSE